MENNTTFDRMFYVLRKAHEMENTLGILYDLFKSQDEPLTTKQIRIAINDGPVLYILRVLEDFGVVKTEKRKEEFITIKDEEWIVRDKEGNIIPAHLQATLDNGEKIEVDNPLYNKLRRYGRWEDVEKKVQVTRKYYTWVG
jgi:hypothetical protein